MLKRTYYIPIVEIIDMRGGFPLMAIAGSKMTPVGNAPARRAPAF